VDAFRRTIHWDGRDPSYILQLARDAMSGAHENEMKKVIDVALQRGEASRLPGPQTLNARSRLHVRVTHTY